ncbi:hypothetical protein AKJ09_04468 [Labilithrix luteola]|uniref:Uncharacterized protein n=1 Tax=Labilithrix luteola TaxID=1391654 RepID=A0A0K1PXE7_9BACT|nr:hypothetical protein AKJ09_04468 [Labilithrix luteola]
MRTFIHGDGRTSRPEFANVTFTLQSRVRSRSERTRAA